MGKFRVEPIIIYSFLGKILIISIKDSLLPPYDSFILPRCLFFLLNFDCISVVYFIYRVPPFSPLLGLISATIPVLFCSAFACWVNTMKGETDAPSIDL